MSQASSIRIHGVLKMGKKLIAYIKKKPIVILLLAIPFAIIAKFGGWDPLSVFIFAALGVIPLAGYIGEATEAFAYYTGPRIGGLLNATLGNAAELIITIVAIREGLLDLVKASITGSILGNLLLVLGTAMFLGGLRHGIQKFDQRKASHDAVLLVLTVLILMIPSLFGHNIEVGPEGSVKIEVLSLGVAAVMMIIYILGLVFSMKMPQNPLTSETPDSSPNHSVWPLKTALVVLAVSTVGVAYLSELFVGVVEPVVEKLGISEFFIGIIFIPIIGNVAEHLVAVQVALRNKMELSVEIAIASSLQIALFVAPLLVFISLLIGNPLTLIFHPFELLALIAGVLIAALVSADGESNWLEGAELLAIYIILGLAFYLLPA
jgi:Ca2+:H+ antiporter